MTPQVKAIDIFSDILFTKDENNKFAITDKEVAKKISLILVNKVIESHYKLLGGVNNTTYKYWQEVKEEITKL